MSEILHTGQTVYTASQHQPITIAEFIAGGGQGEVYRADFFKEPVAVKWYFANYPEQDKLRARVQMLIRSGAPSDCFLWPFGLVESPQVPVFGYVMPLAMPPFVKLPAIWSEEPRPSMRVLATTGMNLAHCFMQVHAQGLCYRDISDGNLFVDPGTGEVRIADNDNVSERSTACEVAGTRGYMAPEVVRREAAPSRTSDLHSLAVVLFQILVVQHPLVGKRELQTPLHMGNNHFLFYGEKPVFIFDPVDHSNGLLPGYREYEPALYYWPIYPQFMRDYFTQAFTAGLRDPENGRVGDAEWRREFARLRDCIYYCPGCGEESFLDTDAVKAAGGKMPPCRHCGGVPPVPVHIRFGKNRVVLNADTRLYPHHVDTRRPFDFSQPVAAVNAGPPMALQNLSAQKWVMRTTEGATQEILPGAGAPLADRSTINFGNLEGVVRL